ncbi:MAG: FmdB family zinc ribbon protein [Pseudonocardia sp.]
MPRYEFRCLDCSREGGQSIFEVSRPMSAASDPASCPAGHDDTVKLLSMVSMVSSVGSGSSGSSGSSGGGGCCGGSCGCG